MLYMDVTSSCKSPLNTGVQRVVRGIYAGLRGRVPVTPLLWSDGWKTYCRLASKEERFLTAPFHQYRRPNARPETLGVPFIWSKTVRHLRQRRARVRLEESATPDDVLFVPEIFQDERTGRLAEIKRWFPGKSAAIFHDAVPLRLPETTKPREQRTFPLYVRALAGFDKVISPTCEAEADLRFYWDSFGVAGGQTSVRAWPTDFGRERVISPSGAAERRVLCVASLHRRKNHLALLAAAEQLWKEGLQFELVLIGRTTAHWGPTVTAGIDRLRRQRRALTWLRHVDDEALHCAYRACSFTAYPSLREGFGLPILESLWHCRPCVCGQNGALGEAAAGGGGCLFVNQQDPTSLANGLRRLLTNQSAYDALYEEACARKFLTWESYIDGLLADLGLR
jgi:glycosyltransferase involved in cell wall biosynthesis